MLRKRIIPIVLLDGFSVLKTINFQQRRNLGSPVTVARTYNTRNVDELILLDIDATKQGRAIDKFTIAEIAQDCFMPLTVGGGIRTIKDIQELLLKGADKVAINSFALDNPLFIKEAADIFGSQCIVASLDIIENDEQFFVYSNGTLRKDIDVVSLLLEYQRMGAGEVLINNVSRDGTMMGANRYLSELTSSALNIPVIYAGGVCSPEDASSIASTPVSGVGISSIFHFTDYTPSDCREAFKKLSLPVR